LSLTTGVAAAATGDIGTTGPGSKNTVSSHSDSNWQQTKKIKMMKLTRKTYQPTKK